MFTWRGVIYKIKFRLDADDGSSIHTIELQVSILIKLGVLKLFGGGFVIEIYVEWHYAGDF